ncbi:MAG TPA: mercury transporter [Gemmatimonadetes bacterium]|nr:mercury transporter [Gemmatimonadota bacterium]HCW78431.1 mercury transporter [Gemmatimonadota bacterium]|tara:strand:+ start:4145 stop:4492 length:348 start_codon:yes stop_codon:yes gene_type:complete
MKPETKATLPSVGGVVAAAGSTLCCAGPVVAVSFGVSGAGFAAFEPWRPYLVGATALFLVAGFVMLDKEERAACEPGKPCADETVRQRMKVTLWVGTLIAVAFATFPTWQTLIFG